MKKITLFLLALLSAGILTAQAKDGNPLYKSGYQGYVDFSLGAATADGGLQTSLLTSHGFSSGFGLYTGLGTGLEWSPNYIGTYFSVPLFLDLKYCFIGDGDFSPYVAMKTGLNISLDYSSSGVYLAPSVGVDIRQHLSLFLKYDYSTVKADIVTFKKHAISVGVAIGF